MLIRNNQADIYLTVDGVQYGGTWNRYSGGGLTAAEAKSRAGGMGAEVSLGGPASRGDITLMIRQDDVVLGWHPTLEAKIGRGDTVAKATVQYLNTDKTVMTGARFGRTGTIKEAFLADVTEENAEQAMYTVVIGSDEKPA